MDGPDSGKEPGRTVASKDGSQQLNVQIEMNHKRFSSVCGIRIDTAQYF